MASGTEPRGPVPEGSGPSVRRGPGAEVAGGARDGGEIALPPELVRFAELFRAGRFWDSHEVLEDPWRATGSTFYHGLILLASAWVHVGRENAHGIDAQLRKATEALDGLPPEYLGVDVAALRRAAVRGRSAVAEHRGDPPERWIERVPPPSLALDPGNVRGDEPELGAAPGASSPEQ